MLRSVFVECFVNFEFGLSDVGDVQSLIYRELGTYQAQLGVLVEHSAVLAIGPCRLLGSSTDTRFDVGFVGVESDHLDALLPVQSSHEASRALLASVVLVSVAVDDQAGDRGTGNRLARLVSG